MISTTTADNPLVHKFTYMSHTPTHMRLVISVGATGTGIIGPGTAGAESIRVARKVEGATA